MAEILQEKRDEFFSFRLLIQHTGIDPDKVSEELGLKPTRQVTAGSDRYTPAGNPLQGKERCTFWSLTFRVSERSELDPTLSTVTQAVARAESFLSSLVNSGGHACLILDLYGDRNYGGMISTQTLGTLAAAGVSLGFEVFPLNPTGADHKED